MKNNIKLAFTLAEVLITLTIIGVIAALTIPNLMQKHQEQEMVTRLKSAYSIFSQAYKMAVLENGSPNEWDIGPTENREGAKKIYAYFKPYLKITKECGYTNTGCFAKNYQALFNKSHFWQPETLDTLYRVSLKNGISAAFYSKDKGCSVISDGQISCGAIYVDLNGKNGPNRAGIDFFEFAILTTGFVGLDRTKPSTSTYTCKYKDTSTTNGALCTGYVLKHGNMDYLRRDVSND